MIRRVLVIIVLVWTACRSLPLSARPVTECRPDMEEPQRDSVSKLDSTVVSASRNLSLIIPGTGLKSSVRTELLRRAPSLLGNSDPLRFVRMLPGVATGSELDAGIHIQGTEHQHCIVSSEGVPIYGASHLLGLFSVFIPGHYSSMEYSTLEHNASRLGGSVEMKLPQDLPERFGGEFNAGLISAEGSVSAPLGKKSALFASLRKSYINTLYGSFLQLDDNAFKYGFGDANLTFLFRPGEDDLVWADFYGGMDNLGYGSYENGMDVDLDWHNLMGALHWQRRREDRSLKQSLYYTGFGLGMDVRHDFFDISMPSDIATAGYKAAFSMKRLAASVDLAFHRAHPQRIASEGGYFRQSSPNELQRAFEGAVSLSYAILDRLDWNVTAVAKGQFFHDGSRLSPYFSPYISASRSLGKAGKLSASAGIQRQFLFQTGLSSVALPYEFWLLAGKYSKPQSSFFAQAGYDLDLEGGAWRLSAEVYWRELRHQLEYKGSILDFVREDYALNDCLLKGDGRNYGLSLMLRKQAGQLTGWAAYTVGRSLRSFDDPGYPDIYPSAHERIHEFNVMASWTSGKWELGGSFVAASGTPFTAVESMYVAQNQLICNFAEHNGARLRPYIRLDFSANWYIRRRPGGRGNGLNFSLYNALGRKNDIFYRINLSEDRRFSYRSIYYKIMFLPSLGYFHKF